MKLLNAEIHVTKSLYAQDNPSSGNGGGGGIGLFFPILIIIGITYFLVMRPQIRRQRALEQKRKSLQKGDTVITAGGLLGKVTRFKDVDEKIIVLEIASGVRVEVLRSSLSDVIAKSSGRDGVSGEEKLKKGTPPKKKKN